MTTVNLEYAQNHLAELVEKAGKGESFIIERTGQPFVRVTPLEAAPPKPNRRIGMLEGQFEVPDDFDDMDSEEIAALFEGE